MKKLTAIILAFMLMTGFCTTLYAEQSLADKLCGLGLFLGTDEGFELDKELTRTEAVVMTLRAMGKAEVAAEYDKTHPFTDVPEWADSYISYAFDNGIAQGVSDTLFGAGDMVESNMFLTFILRAMGYEDGDYKDFLWQMPYALAGELDMLPTKVELIDFVRRDAVTLMASALFAKCKDGVCLYEKLISQGVFTNEQWESAFPSDPFEDYKAQNRAVGAAVRANNGESKSRFNDFYFYNHLLLDVIEKEDYAEAIVIESHAHYMVSDENKIVGSGSGMGGYKYLLDKSNWQVIYGEDYGVKRTDYFPESAIGTETYNLVWNGLNMRLGKEVDRIILEGGLAYRKPTHAEKMEKYADQSMYDIVKRYDTDEYTLIAGYLAGVPHGPAGFMYIIYKPGSEMGDGTAVGLPLPEINAWAAQRIPDELNFSEDGKTLTYSFTFDERMVLEYDGEVKRVIHEAGTYNYKTDLATGETTLEIVK